MQTQDNKEPTLVNPVSVDACCDTCTELSASGIYCLRWARVIKNKWMICREGGYNADPEAINRIVIERQK